MTFFDFEKRFRGALSFKTRYKKSKTLAKYIVGKLHKTAGFANRGVVERNDLAVLNGTKMPAVIVEVGYMSHSGDIKNIVNNKGKNAKAIVQGIKEYFKKGN